MFFIVLSHYVVHSGIDAAKLNNAESIMMHIFTLGNLGVDIFVILSGYYMINSKFKIKKLIMLECQSLFYTLTCGIIFFACGYMSINIRQIELICMPTIFGHYWFFSAYVIMYIFTPLINTLIHTLSKQNLLKWIIIMILIWSVPTTIFSIDLYSFPLGTFLLLYCIGAYLRLYPDFKFNTKKNAVMVVVSCSMFLILSVIVLEILGMGRENYFFERLSLPTLMLATGIFIVFTHIRPRHNHFINLIATSTFGIYLIHENAYIREVLWSFLQTVRGGISHIFFALICATVVFIMCSIIELMRSRTVGVLADKLITKFLLKLKCTSIFMKK